MPAGEAEMRLAWEGRGSSARAQRRIPSLFDLSHALSNLLLMVFAALVLAVAVALAVVVADFSAGRQMLDLLRS